MRISRRQWLSAAPGGVIAARAAAAERPILRRALVSRHNPVLRAFAPAAPLSVGNGEFAFTADITGLQTCPELYEKTVPLCTQSQWGWHSFPRADSLTSDDLELTQFDTWGRKVGYPTSAGRQKDLFEWLRQNPHRLHLARIGFDLPGARIEPIEQTLDLWTGTLRSRFRVDGREFQVETACHPRLDLLAVRVRPGLPVVLAFPYASPEMSAADWKNDDRHRTTLATQRAGRVDVRRELDRDGYYVALESSGAILPEPPHRLRLQPAESADSLEFVCRFSARTPSAELPSSQRTLAESAAHWEQFWSQGGAIELDGSRDPRAPELERRVVLSQYLTAIQCAGSLPPQETGLTCNSWYGKFHLEMHWWHAAHFPLWGRAPLLARSLDWYISILPQARRKARLQGYAGARWPKMVGPEGHDSPSPIGPLLIWQQPHPIALAELCYRAHPSKETLHKYADLVFESAEFMSSYAHLDSRGRYVLGPPVIPAQENHPPRETWNPTFELEYWARGLELAQIWRRRLRLVPRREWGEVRAKLSQLPVKDGVYLAHENCSQTYTERNRDHPSMLAALGVLPGAKVDRETMRRTLRRVQESWRWPDTWGWDYPMMAMTAARLGEPSLAVDSLLMETPKNTWQANGHNWQRENLPLYLPSNGGLLTAVAMMATTWEGFPKETWRARWENSAPALAPATPGLASIAIALRLAASTAVTLCLAASASLVGQAVSPANEILVAQEGAANFTTVQSAIDSIPDANTRPVVIRIKPGIYKEKITVPKEKPFITLQGEDAARTILTFNNSHATTGGTSSSASFYVWAHDFAAENLTFENSYGTGSQAVALYVNADRAVFRHCRLLGWQDTLYANGGRQYYKDCYIEGHVDFIFGNATAVFEDCLIHSKGAGFVTAQSKLVDTPTTGYVFRHCRLTGSDTGAGVFLGRPWRPYARVVYIECDLGRHIRAEGWDNWRNAENEKTAWFAEYRSTGPGANAAARVGWSKQLTEAQAAEFATARFLKGDDGWNPEKAK